MAVHTKEHEGAHGALEEELDPAIFAEVVTVSERAAGEGHCFATDAAHGIDAAHGAARAAGAIRLHRLPVTHGVCLQAPPPKKYKWIILPNSRFRRA